ncbi:MAG TPA: hypothetical protein VG101_01075 [Puia sp.]|jgi:hypothetical protein|nr:hypothetical protein [Puia sp.]
MKHLTIRHLTIRHLSACLSIAMVLLLFNSYSLRAQGHFNTPAYTPHFTPHYQPMYFNTYYGTVSTKHRFKIVFTDGTDTIVYSTIHADTPSYYIMLENKSVKKKDSARFRKIYPSQTRYIVRFDGYDATLGKYEDSVSKGLATDSCWLFKDIDGKVSAYTPLAEDDVDDGFLRYIQMDQGPLIEINKQNLMEMLKANEKAAGQAESGKYAKAIKTYNKSTK